jgi:hypothetical protein
MFTKGGKFLGRIFADRGFLGTCRFEDGIEELDLILVEGAELVLETGCLQFVNVSIRRCGEGTES